MTTSGSERGSATVLALALIGPLLLAGFVAAGVTQLAIARQQLATAADLAAIAAAKSWGAPCEQARIVAVSHGVALARCTAVDADWQIEVVAPIDSIALRLLTFAGRGPTELRERAIAGYE